MYVSNIFYKNCHRIYLTNKTLEIKTKNVNFLELIDQQEVIGGKHLQHTMSFCDSFLFPAPTRTSFIEDTLRESRRKRIRWIPDKRFWNDTLSLRKWGMAVIIVFTECLISELSIAQFISL